MLLLAIGTILGVFTLVVLLRPQVKAAFAGQAGVPVSGSMPTAARFETSAFTC